MRNHSSGSVLVGTVILVAAVAGLTRPSHGQQKSDWTVEVTPYFWLAEMDGTVSVRRFDADVDQNLSDAWDMLVDNFNMAATTHIEVHNRQWGVFGDIMYLSLESEAAGPLGAGDIDVEFEQIVAELGGFYRVIGARQTVGDDELPAPTVDLLAGARYTDLDIEIDPSQAASRDRSENWIDPIIGVRGSMALAQWLSVFARGDIGGFGIDQGTTSNLTWNILAGVQIPIGSRSVFLAGYRWLDTDYESDDDRDFEYDILASGPFIGLTMKW